MPQILRLEVGKGGEGGRDKGRRKEEKREERKNPWEEDEKEEWGRRCRQEEVIEKKTKERKG